MPTIQRTVRDIHALCLPQDLTENEYEEGDPVEIPRRSERLEEYGWIESEGEGYVMTERGAAIINHFTELQNDGGLLDAMENGAGRFVDDALEQGLHEHEFGDWSPAEVTDDAIIMQRSCTVCDETEHKEYERDTE